MTYCEQLRRRIPCPDFGVELTVVLMKANIQRMHGTEPVNLLELVSG